MTTASYTHNNGTDWIVLEPQRIALQVTPAILVAYLAADPEWDGWRAGWADDSDATDPEDYGEILATRRDDGPVEVLDETAWQRRLDFHGLEVTR